MCEALLKSISSPAQPPIRSPIRHAAIHLGALISAERWPSRPAAPAVGGGDAQILISATRKGYVEDRSSNEALKRDFNTFNRPSDLLAIYTDRWSVAKRSR